MNPSKFAPVAFALLLTLGCQSGPKAPVYVVDDSAPALEQGKPLNEFLIGTWAFQDMTTGGELDQQYEFKSDGTFTLVKGKDRIGGSWTAQADGVALRHETLGDKTIQQASEEIKKQEEVGTQAGVQAGVFHDWLMNDLGARNYAQLDEDRTGFVFTSGAATPDPNEMDSALMGIKGNLVRLVISAPE